MYVCTLYMHCISAIKITGLSGLLKKELNFTNGFVQDLKKIDEEESKGYVVFKYASAEQGGGQGKRCHSFYGLRCDLKVPKCEISDLFDFNDFYVMKCL
jgi:hypothetical protein